MLALVPCTRNPSSLLYITSFYTIQRVTFYATLTQPGRICYYYCYCSIHRLCNSVSLELHGISSSAFSAVPRPSMKLFRVQDGSFRWFRVAFVSYDTNCPDNFARYSTTWLPLRRLLPGALITIARKYIIHRWVNPAAGKLIVELHTPYCEREPERTLFSIYQPRTVVASTVARY